MPSFIFIQGEQMTRQNEISEQLTEGLLQQEKEKWQVVEQLRMELDTAQKAFAEARKKIPTLEQRLSLKTALRDKVLSEVMELENEIALSEQTVSRESNTSFSRIEGIKRELTRAEFYARTFIETKVKELTQ
jgi:hypothetical protein